MDTIINAIKPVLLRFSKSNAVKQLIVDLLGAYAQTTDNKIDDGIVDIVAGALGLKEEK